MAAWHYSCAVIFLVKIRQKFVNLSEIGKNILKSEYESCKIINWETKESLLFAYFLKGR